MKEKYKVKAKREMRTYSFLRQAAYMAYKEAERTETGRSFSCMSTMLYSAFCLEAYLNHLGEELTNYWDEMKKPLGPEAKLIVLSALMEFEVDRGRQPFQTFGEVFQFRNWLVHGRTARLQEQSDQMLTHDERPAMPIVKWEEKLTLEEAKKFLDNSKAMVKELHSAAGFKEAPFSSGDTWEWSARSSPG